MTDTWTCTVMPPCPSHCSYTNSIQSRFPLDSAVSLFKSKGRLTASFQNVEVGKAFFSSEAEMSNMFLHGSRCLYIDIFLGIFKKTKLWKLYRVCSSSFNLVMRSLADTSWSFPLGLFILAQSWWWGVLDLEFLDTSLQAFRCRKSCWCDETFLEKILHVTWCYMFLLPHIAVCIGAFPSNIMGGQQLSWH